MNKLMFGLIVMVLCCGNLRAQFVSGSSNAFDESFVLITKSADLSRVEGTPYLEENFQAGILHMKEKQPLSVFLRYDVVNERMEIKPDLNSTETYMLPNNQSTEYVIGGNKFILDKVTADAKTIYGYFIELYSGDGYRLLKKPVATLSEAVKAKTGYDKDRPAEIEIDNSYYLSENDQVRELEIKNRKIRSAFSSERAKEYLKSNKIRSEEDMVSFLSFLDQ